MNLLKFKYTLLLIIVLSFANTISAHEESVLQIKSEELSKYWSAVITKPVRIRPNGAPKPDAKALVLVKVVIEQDGKVSDVKVIKNESDGLFNMADFINAYKDNEYKPVTGFHPIKTTFLVRFALNVD
jgi:hypothetical protein